MHATEPTPEQQGVGFDRAFTWDVPLTDGYHSLVVRRAQTGDRVDSSHFRGLDVPEIGGAIAATKPDVVLITGWYSITLVRALHACRRLRIPALYRGDSHLLSGPRGGRRLAWALKTRYLLSRFDGYLSPGRRVNEYLKRFGVPEYRVFNVPHAVDNAMFQATAAPYQEPGRRAEARREWGIDPDAFVVLFVGKLIRSKRPLNVVRALARLQGRGSMLVVGSGPLDATLREEAHRFGVELHMVGFLNQTELGRAYALADCLALPSDFPETWGLVVNEALATGLPVVVSAAVGCAPDLVRDGYTGYIYPLDDVEALAGDSIPSVSERPITTTGPSCRAQVVGVQLRGDDGRIGPRLPVRAAPLARPRSRLGRVLAPHPDLLRTDGRRRRARAHDVRGASCDASPWRRRRTASSTAGRTSASRRWPRPPARAGRPVRTGSR